MHHAERAPELGHDVLGRLAERQELELAALAGANPLQTFGLIVKGAAGSAEVYDPSAKGWALAVASGAVTSALGYALWYHVLKDITVTRASIAQLSVPAIAALGGVIFVAEPLTFRFLAASALILSGVAAATLTRNKSKTQRAAIN